MPKEFSRTDRVAGVIQRVLAEILVREFKDPRLNAIVTLSEVTVTKDLMYAKIYYSILGDVTADEIKTTNALLNSAVSFFRRRLGQETKFRHVPELKFIYDTSLVEGNRLSKLIDEACAKDESKNEK